MDDIYKGKEHLRPVCEINKEILNMIIDESRAEPGRPATQYATMILQLVEKYNQQLEDYKKTQGN